MTKYIISERCTGKSTKLIEAAMADPQGIVVVANMGLLKYWEDKYPKGKFMLYNRELFDGIMHGNLYFDDIECILRATYKQNIKMITASLEE
jgi:hypothetical protein